MRVKYLIPFLVFVLVFGFGLFTSCKAEEIVEEEIIEEPVEEIIEPVKEEIIEEEVIEEVVDLIQNFDGIEIKCTRVIDGDTIEVKDEAGTKYKIRYIGIDTPEAFEDYGDITTEKNKELVEGNIVKLEKDVSSTDKYGRILAYVYVGDIFVNAYLVQEGYAQISTYPPDVKYADYFLELQQEAKENNKGLWSIEIVEEEKEQEQEEQIEEEPVEEQPIEEQPVEEEPVEEEQPIEEEPQQGQYCGSINSDVYHYPSCGSAKRINPENLIWFIDENDAKSEGYRPCKKCNPPG
jgi:micrococcal nuclease